MLFDVEIFFVLWSYQKNVLMLLLLDLKNSFAPFLFFVHFTHFAFILFILLSVWSILSFLVGILFELVSLFIFIYFYVFNGGRLIFFFFEFRLLIYIFFVFFDIVSSQLDFVVKGQGITLLWRLSILNWSSVMNLLNWFCSTSS